MEKMKADILFLLVGSNPMPNFLAYLSRVKRNGKIYMIHTEETKPIAQRLENLIRLKSAKAQIVLFETDRAEPAKIKAETRAKLEQVISRVEKGMILELHYTGGTKAMTVHVHSVFREVEERYRDRFIFSFSYLDADEECIYYDLKNKESLRDLIDQEESFTIQELSSIHEVALNDQINREQIDPSTLGLCKQLLQTCLSAENNNISGSPQEKYLEHIMDLCSKAEENMKRKKPIRQKNEVIEKNIREMGTQELEIEFEGQKYNFLKAYKTFEELLEGAEDKLERLRILRGTWLEYYVFHCIQNLYKRYPEIIMDYGNSVKRRASKENNQNEFEVDVLVLMRYKLYGISTTVCETKEKCKFKLFEIKERAIQIGGQEAGICLVCLYHNSQTLQAEILNTWKTTKNLLIIGLDRLGRLEEYLTAWLTQGRI